MELDKSAQIALMRLAMQRVNVVPYDENMVAFGTNTKEAAISKEPVAICECYINVVNRDRTCHVGFSAVLSAAVRSEFWLEVDGADRSKKYTNVNSTMQFMDFFLLDVGLHHIAVKAEAESPVRISPREARLGVYL